MPRPGHTNTGTLSLLRDVRVHRLTFLAHLLHHDRRRIRLLLLLLGRSKWRRGLRTRCAVLCQAAWQGGCACRSCCCCSCSEASEAAGRIPCSSSGGRARRPGTRYGLWRGHQVRLASCRRGRLHTHAHTHAQGADSAGDRQAEPGRSQACLAKQSCSTQFASLPQTRTSLFTMLCDQLTKGAETRGTRELCCTSPCSLHQL